ncbi:MAG: transglycosylase SLT domain-containing protein [Bacteroidia bacterium]|jgi:membrane-bound lytic murein transglycosylase D|nr:transglycosylase SLT domain-containing protein [Bacteroidia bacterium]
MRLYNHKRYLKLLTIATMCCLLCVSAHPAFGQRVLIPADLEVMSAIDSHTVRLAAKVSPQIPQGDLNIYGFDLEDIPIYADSVYAYRLSLLESEIPLEYNEYVRPYIDLYTIRRRKLSSKILAWSAYYFPQFEQALDREKMPMELKYLAVIESALNPAATSPVGAAGMWQFMAPTGRMYGLKTTAAYDERRDVQKSTDAAIKYLRNSYRIYGDWLLVIASYNCGPGNVNKAIRKAGGVKNFWAIQQYLPRETRGYVPAFIAATYMMNYASEHNLYPSEEVTVYGLTDTILVDNSLSLTQVANLSGVDIETLKQLNPSLRHGVIPFTNQPIVLTVPYNHSMQFTQQLANKGNNSQSETAYLAVAPAPLPTLNPKPSSPSQLTYTVRKGDHLGAIANKHGVSVAELKKWNRLRSNRIQTGQKLKVSTKA